MGLTYTGVAFCATDWSTPRIINRWPGINEIRNKVPTAVGYRAGTKVFTSWGFGCPPPGKLDRGEAVKDCFKLFLDPEFLEKTFKDSAGCPVGRYGDVRSDDVRDWYKDFLTGLYKHIGEYISSSFELADWGKHTVDFLFSVPTTWEESVTNEFKKIVKDAGFGKDGEGHSVNIRLTEAEAAAVYTAASPHNHIPLSAWGGDAQSVNESTAKGSDMREGNIILVCDSGGGTTDVSVVKVISLKYIDAHGREEMEKVTELEQLDKAIGDAIGSVQIDETFRERVDERLKDILYKFPSVQLPEYAADDMVKGEFQYIKEGIEENPPLPKILLKIPGLPRNFTFPEGMIESGHMVFTQNDIREIFDIQISGIFDLIDRQLIRINGLRSEKVSHFVLSGGLCSSKYVQSQLSSRYGLFGQGIKILIDKNPQLVVCKGLVIDRLHQLKYNTFILPSLRCRSSYGILYNEPFDNKKIYDKKTRIRRDPNDGKKYAIGQIHWFLRQGELISRDKPISHDFFRFIDVGSPEMVWKDTIARSDSQAERLPSSIYEGDATAVCDIESILSVDTLEKIQSAKKQKRLFGIKIGKVFWKISHKVLVHVSSANVRFEVQFNGNVVGSRTVPVKWALGLGEVKQHSADNTVGEEDGDWRHCLILE